MRFQVSSKTLWQRRVCLDQNLLRWVGPKQVANYGIRLLTDVTRTHKTQTCFDSLFPDAEEASWVYAVHRIHGNKGVLRCQPQCGRALDARFARRAGISLLFPSDLIRPTKSRPLTFRAPFHRDHPPCEWVVAHATMPSASIGARCGRLNDTASEMACVLRRPFGCGNIFHILPPRRR